MRRKPYQEIFPKLPEPPKPNDVMEVYSIPINNRVLIAKDSDKKTHTVYVGRNDTFCHGDLIEVVPHKSEKGVLALVSPIPRDKRRPFGAQSR